MLVGLSREGLRLSISVMGRLRRCDWRAQETAEVVFVAVTRLLRLHCRVQAGIVVCAHGT
jgi:hypothetical protein